MGKKFRALNKALRDVPERSLICINDLPLRKNASKDFFKILKQIEKIETKKKLFFEKDQSLFSNWFHLTFKNEEELVAKLHEKYRPLAIKFNWIVAESQMKNIEMEESYLVIQSEEDDYNKGLRVELIEQARKHRNDFIEGQISNQYDFDDDNDDDIFNYDDEDSIEDDQDTAYYTDAEIKNKFNTFQGGMVFLLEILGNTSYLQGASLFLKAWDFAPKNIKKAFKQFISDTQGENFEDFISELKKVVKECDNAKPAEDNYDDLNESDFINHKQIQNKKTNLNPVKMEELKLYYRKLVRIIHPDIQGEDNKDSFWMSEIWSKIQSAYQNQDLNQLKKHYLIVQLRLNKLSSLTFSEISEATNSLQEELINLNNDIEKFKQDPSWGFSTKKSYDSLYRKLIKPFKERQHDLNNKIEEVEDQFKVLRLLAYRPRMRNQKNTRNKKKSTQKHFSRRDHDMGQQSFNFE